MARCPKCRHQFRTMEDEGNMHECPRCGYGPEDAEAEEVMIHDPEDEVTVISAEGVQKGVLHGNTITVVKEVAMETETRPTVKLVGNNGNAFVVMAACRTAARKAGWSKERIDVLLKDMMAGDYDHLLGVAMREFDVE